jgi:hypothetical protein
MVSAPSALSEAGARMPAAMSRALPLRPPGSTMPLEVTTDADEDAPSGGDCGAKDDDARTAADSDGMPDEALSINAVWSAGRTMPVATNVGCVGTGSTMVSSSSVVDPGPKHKATWIPNASSDAKVRRPHCEHSNSDASGAPIAIVERGISFNGSWEAEIEDGPEPSAICSTVAAPEAEAIAAAEVAAAWLNRFVMRFNAPAFAPPETMTECAAQLQREVASAHLLQTGSYTLSPLAHLLNNIYTRQAAEDIRDSPTCASNLVTGNVEPSTCTRLTSSAKIFAMGPVTTPVETIAADPAVAGAETLRARGKAPCKPPLLKCGALRK